jgi:hypothetical protein
MSSLAGSARPTPEKESNEEAKPTSTPRSTTAVGSNRVDIGDDDLPDLIIGPAFTVDVAPAHLTGISPPMASSDGLSCDETDVDMSDDLDSLHDDDLDDLEFPEDFISCSCCANRKIKEIEARLDVTELELTESQAKVVKIEVQRDAAIALNATLKAELQIIEQKRLSEALVPTAQSLSAKQRRELESRLHTSEGHFHAMLGNLSTILGYVKGLPAEKTVGQISNELCQLLERATRRAVVSHGA